MASSLSVPGGADLASEAFTTYRNFFLRCRREWGVLVKGRRLPVAEAALLLR